MVKFENSIHLNQVSIEIDDVDLSRMKDEKITQDFDMKFDKQANHDKDVNKMFSINQDADQQPSGRSEHAGVDFDPKISYIAK